MEDTSENFDLQDLFTEIQTISNSNKSLMKAIAENQAKLHSEVLRAQEYSADIAEMLIPLLSGEDKELAQIKLSQMVQKFI